MADQFDQAQDAEARNTAVALAAQQARAAATEHPAATGECLNPLCGEPLDGDRLFCGPACAKEHAKRVK